MRSIGGTGAGNGPFITIHDGFVEMATNVSSGGWDGFLNGWDRVALDSHRYLCFSDPNNWGLSYQASLVRDARLLFSQDCADLARPPGFVRSPATTGRRT